MRTITAFTEEQIEYFIAHKSLPKELLESNDKVAIILTQDWCHEWHDMRSYLEKYLLDVAIFFLEYNKHPKFETIMSIKENELGNRLVPYLIYFYNGEQIAATNWLPEKTFQSLLSKTKPFKVLS